MNERFNKMTHSHLSGDHHCRITAAAFIQELDRKAGLVKCCRNAVDILADNFYSPKHAISRI
jgi:hypothetical protein